MATSPARPIDSHPAAKPAAAPESASPRDAPAPAPRRRRRLSLQTLFVIALVAIGAFLGFREIRGRITHVQETDARIAADLITVSTRVDGWVTAIHVEEGAAITAGQVLATVDDRSAKLLLAQLEAQRAGMQAERERLVAERRLVDEQTQSHLLTRETRLRTARAVVAALEPQLELARSEFARVETLIGDKVISRQQFEQTRATLQRVEADHITAVARLEEARAELEEARAERARLDVLDREIDKLVHREAELAGRVEQQRVDIEDRTIRSTIDGVVDRTFVEAGEYVSAGQRLAIVHDPDRVWVEANVKETQVRKLREGQPVEIAIDAYPDETFTGEVRNIGQATTASYALLPNPNPSGNFTKITQRLPIRIAVAQSDGRLRPGMMVEIRIDIRPR